MWFVRRLRGCQDLACTVCPIVVGDGIGQKPSGIGGHCTSAVHLAECVSGSVGGGLLARLTGGLDEEELYGYIPEGKCCHPRTT